MSKGMAVVDRQPTEADGERLTQAVEAFARDLVGLVRAVRVYPAEHPFLRNLSGRLAAAVGGELPEPLSVGVTARELAVGTCFVGGRDSRAADLAALLHGRRVLRLTWTRDAGEADVIGFAELLGEPRLVGDALGKALRRRRIFSIDVEPLILERIHDAFREVARGGSTQRESREAWLWLLSDEVPPEEIAEFLASDGFWEAPLAGEEGAEATSGAPLTEVLLRMGQRLEAALDRLPAGQRRKVTDRLARAGRQITPQQLASILRAADAGGVLEGPVGDALEQTFGGDKLVDLLAGMVVQEGRNTQRLADVYRRFAPGEAEQLLATVRARQASPDKGGFTVEVWEAVEDFLLGLREDPYMGSDYSSSLERFAAVPQEASTPLGDADFRDEVEEHLDRVVLGLGLIDPPAWGASLLDRLEVRLEAHPPADLLTLAEEIEGSAPGLLDSRPALVERVFRTGVDRLRELDVAGREAFLRFGREHERVLLEPVLRALAEEEGMSVRRFLVEMVAGFSPSSTPVVVSRVRSAPWYVTRNLTIALGRRGEEAAIPVLRSLLDHEHPKVRREAILAFGHYDVEVAREALRDVVGAASQREERALAERALRLAATSGTRP